MSPRILIVIDGITNIMQLSHRIIKRGPMIVNWPDEDDQDASHMRSLNLHEVKRAIAFTIGGRVKGPDNAAGFHRKGWSGGDGVGIAFHSVRLSFIR